MDKEIEMKQLYFCNVKDQNLMRYYCTQNNITLETDSSIISNQYFSCQIILIMGTCYMEKGKKNLHITSLVIYQRNKGILEHKCNLDDQSIKIQCFSNGNGLSA